MNESRLTDRSILRNILSLGTADLFNKLLPLVTFPYVVRVIGPEAFGTANFGLAYVSFFLLFVDFGLNVYSVRELSLLKERKKFISEIFTLKLFLMFATLAIFLITAFTLPVSPGRRWVLYAFGGLIVYNALEFQWILQGIEDLRPYATGSIISNLVKIAAIFLFIDSPEDLLIYVMVITGSNFFILIVEIFYLYRKNIRIWISLSKNLPRHLIRALPLAISIVSITIYTRSDTLMLSFMKNDSIVGIYNAGYYIIFGALSFLTIVNTVFFPIVSRTVNEKTAQRYQMASMRTMQLVGFSLLTMLFIFSREVLDIVLGDQYGRTLFSFRILLFTIPLIAYSFVFGGQIMLSRGKFKTYSSVIVLAGIMNIVANFILIPSLSEVGAAIATLLTELIVLIFFWYFSMRIMKLPMIVQTFKYACIFLVLLLTRILLEGFFSIVPILILLTVLYSSSLFLLKMISMKDIRTILGLLIGRG